MAGLCGTFDAAPSRALRALRGAASHGRGKCRVVHTPSGTGGRCDIFTWSAGAAAAFAVVCAPAGEGGTEFRVEHGAHQNRIPLAVAVCAVVMALPASADFAKARLWAGRLLHGFVQQGMRPSPSETRRPHLDAVVAAIRAHISEAAGGNEESKSGCCNIREHGVATAAQMVDRLSELIGKSRWAAVEAVYAGGLFVVAEFLACITEAGSAHEQEELCACIAIQSMVPGLRALHRPGAAVPAATLRAALDVLASLRGVLQVCAQEEAAAPGLAAFRRAALVREAVRCSVALCNIVVPAEQGLAALRVLPSRELAAELQARFGAVDALTSAGLEGLRVVCHRLLPTT